MAAPLIQKHLRAIELRKEGKSYSQIKNELQVSKSSLSLWLRDFPLPHEILVQLRDFNEKRIESFRNTWRRKRAARLRSIYKSQQQVLLPLTKRELYVAGLFLYWGEGGKTSNGMASLSNTNPKVMKFFLKWLTEILEVPKDKVIVRLHLYKDMDVRSETQFWSRELNLPLEQFRKPYIKETTLRGLTYKTIGHGTCNLIVYGQELREKILMGMEVVGDAFIEGKCDVC